MLLDTKFYPGQPKQKLDDCVRSLAMANDDRDELIREMKRIEFVYQSRNFRAHGHDPDQCDVIVCWEDNWPDCPVEVLELKSELARLSSQIQPE